MKDVFLLGKASGRYPARKAVSPIGTSGQGGGRIAAAIAELMREQDPGARRTAVYGQATC